MSDPVPSSPIGELPPMGETAAIFMGLHGQIEMTFSRQSVRLFLASVEVILAVASAGLAQVKAVRDLEKPALDAMTFMRDSYLRSLTTEGSNAAGQIYNTDTSIHINPIAGNPHDIGDEMTK